MEQTDRDWALGNPWLWMGLGLGCCGLAWLWMGVFGQHVPAGRFALLTVGLLTAAVSVVIRLKFTQPVFLAGLSSRRRNLILAALALLLHGLALTVTVLLALGFMRPESAPFRWGPMLVAWFALVPMAEFAATQSFRRLWQGEPLSQREEAAALLLLAALACHAAARSLFDSQDPFSMDSMRVFLGVLTLTALAAAPLVLVPQDVRRKVVSFLVVLHFAGIMTITLVVVNPPWALKQLADRIFRPYLQFFYITNAYHFYAPEPAPNAYMWFRILFVDRQGRETGQWLKVPDLNEKGEHSYPTSLTYVRHMCIMDHAAPSLSTPFFDVNGQAQKFYKDRLLRTPGLFFMSEAKLLGQSQQKPAESVAIKEPTESGAGGRAIKGSDQPKNAGCKPARGELGQAKPGETRLMIPWHPNFTADMQFRRPAPQAQALLSSFARHILAKAQLSADGKLVFQSWFSDNDHASADWKVKSVKVYHVTHAFLSPEAYRLGVDEPWDPHTYRGIYLGEYDAEGNLVDAQDPFLYWTLPVIRETQERDAVYRDYIRRHAGDPAWVRNEKKEWGPAPDETTGNLR